MSAHPSSKTALATFVLMLGALGVAGEGAAGEGVAGEGAAGEEHRWPALFRDTAEVAVVNVDVFVSDRAGRPVGGLGKDDFRLFVDGRPVEIRHFYAVQGGRDVSPAAAAPEGLVVPPRERELRLVLFVDNEHIGVAGRRKLFQHLRELVLEHRRKDVSVMVLSREGSAADSLVVRQGFTTVGHEIFVALDELEKTSTTTSRLDLERRELMRAIEDLDVGSGFGFESGKDDPALAAARAETAARALLPRIHAYAGQRHEQVLASLGVLARVVDMLAAVPGRKALFYAGDGLPLRAGQGLLESWAGRVEGLASLAGETSTAAETARFDATRAVSDLVERANAARLAFYTLDASPPAPLRRGAAESRASSATSSVASVEEAAGRDSLVLMARETGGRAGLGHSMLEATLRGLVTDFDHYYSLGFAPEGAGSEPRSVEVGLGRPGLDLRWRRGFRLGRPEQLAERRLLAALVLGETGADDDPLGIVLEESEITPAEDGGGFVVPLLVRVPLGKLVLVPEKHDHTARVSMYVAARDGRGRSSDVTRHVCPVRIPNSEILLALGRTMVCGVRLRMRAGPQEVAVAVRDEVAETMSVVRFQLDVGPGPVEPAAGETR